MSFLKEFFRPEEDGFIFQPFSFWHYVLIVTLLSGAWIIFKHREHIRQNKRLNHWLKVSFILMAVVDQLLYMYFCFFLRKDGWVEGLPLYSCRAALYMGVIALVTDFKPLKGVTVYWGLFGGVLPMIQPDMLHYSWPHFTNVHFFIFHFMIFWLANYFLFVDGYDFDTKSYRYAFLVVNAFLTFTLIVNMLVGANYAYMFHSPVLRPLFDRLPKVLYLAFIYGVYNSLVFLVHATCLKLSLPDLAKASALRSLSGEEDACLASEQQD